MTDCPQNPEGFKFEDCKTCPMCVSWKKLYGDTFEVVCKNLTEKEIKLLPEPSKDVEYESAW